MLEEDYLAKEKNQLPTRGDVQSESKMNVSPSTSTKDLASTIIREVVLPALEKEVNEGKNFAQLRQIFSAMILAQWYKRTLKDSLLGKAYVNQQKVDGVNHGDPKANQAIYQQYLQAFKKGAYNYIKEDYDQYTNQAIPRKYFSGGVDAGMTAWQDAIHFTNRAQASEVLGDLVGAGMDNTVVDLSPNKGNAAMAIDMIGLEQRDIFMSKVRELPFFSVISTDDNMGPFAFYQVMIPVDDKYGLYGLSKLANLFEQIGLMNKIKTGAALLDDDIKAMMLEMKWYFRNGRRVGLNANILGKLDKMGQGQRVDLRRWLDMNIGESVDEISPKNIVKFKSQFEHFFSNDQFSLQRAGELMMLLFKMASTPGEKQESLLKALTSLYEASEKIQQQAQEVPAQDLVNNHRHGLAVGQNTQIRVYDPRRIKSGNPYEAVMQYQQAIGELFPFIMGVILDMCDAIQPPARS